MQLRVAHLNMQLGGMTRATSSEGGAGPASAHRKVALPTAATARGGWKGKHMACVCANAKFECVCVHDMGLCVRVHNARVHA